MKAATPDEVIKMLNPKIVGWSNYFKTEVSTKAFQRLDNLLWQKLSRWAKRRHSHKNAHWIVNKYFTPIRQAQAREVRGGNPDPEMARGDHRQTPGSAAQRREPV